MKLVHLEQYELKVEDELLLLKPFRRLYQADRTKNKEHFIEFLSIIYFLIDPRSDYQYIINEQSRLKEICETNGYKIKSFTKEEEECIEIYRKLTTTTSLELLKSVKITIENVKRTLESFDFSECDPDKKANALKSVASVAAMMPKLVKDLQETEKLVVKEVEEASRARGNSEMSLFDNGINL